MNWIITFYLFIGVTFALFTFGLNINKRGVGLRNLFFSGVYVLLWFPLVIIGTAISLNELKEAQEKKQEARDAAFENMRRKMDNKK